MGLIQSSEYWNGGHLPTRATRGERSQESDPTTAEPFSAANLAYRSAFALHSPASAARSLALAFGSTGAFCERLRQMSHMKSIRVFLLAAMMTLSTVALAQTNKVSYHFSVSTFKFQTKWFVTPSEEGVGNPDICKYLFMGPLPYNGHYISIPTNATVFGVVVVTDGETSKVIPLFTWSDKKRKSLRMQRPDAMVRTNRGHARRSPQVHRPGHQEMTMIPLPNQAAPVNAPVAPRFQMWRPWRRATEQRRWAKAAS